MSTPAPVPTARSRQVRRLDEPPGTPASQAQRIPVPPRPARAAAAPPGVGLVAASSLPFGPELLVIHRPHAADGYAKASAHAVGWDSRNRTATGRVTRTRQWLPAPRQRRAGGWR